MADKLHVICPADWGGCANRIFNKSSSIAQESAMDIAQKQINLLRQHINEGFKVGSHFITDGIHHFVIPALDYDNYMVDVPDGAEINEYMASAEYRDAQLTPRKVGVVLLDLVGFSKNTNENQLKLIVRYQCEVRRAIHSYPVDMTLSIGDGTIFVFEECHIDVMAECILAIDHAIAGYNLDQLGSETLQIEHRMGVHVGLAYRFIDYNRQSNYIGSGINIAQRVSTCVPNKRTCDFFANSPVYVSVEAKNEMEARGCPDYVKFYDMGDKPVKHEVVHVYAMHRETREPTRRT